MAPLLRNNVMRSQGISGYFKLVRLVKRSLTPSQFNSEINWIDARAIFDTQRNRLFLNNQ
jgi:hypothetical protein